MSEEDTSGRRVRDTRSVKVFDGTESRADGKRAALCGRHHYWCFTENIRARRAPRKTGAGCSSCIQEHSVCLEAEVGFGLLAGLVLIEGQARFVRNVILLL